MNKSICQKQKTLNLIIVSEITKSIEIYNNITSTMDIKLQKRETLAKHHVIVHKFHSFPHIFVFLCHNI